MIEVDLEKAREIASTRWYGLEIKDQHELIDYADALKTALEIERDHNKQLTEACQAMYDSQQLDSLAAIAQAEGDAFIKIENALKVGK